MDIIVEPQNFDFTDKFKKLRIYTSNIIMAGRHKCGRTSLLKAPKPPITSGTFTVNSKTNKGTQPGTASTQNMISYSKLKDLTNIHLYQI